MKRYLLFYGETYYPIGGWRDFKGSFDSVDQAIEQAVKTSEFADWYQIVDTQTMELIQDATVEDQG